MVTKKILKDKENNVLKTKDGQEMYDFKFEIGDKFIPIVNNLFSKPVQIIDNGEIKIIHNHKVKVKIKDYPKANEEEEIFVSLTPTQANFFIDKIDSGIAINQYLYEAYSYKDNKGSDWVGIDFETNVKPPKKFSDF